MDNKVGSHHEEEVAMDYTKDVSGLDGYEPNTEEERKLVRKIDMFLLPTIWLMYLLSYMDRTK